MSGSPTIASMISRSGRSVRAATGGVGCALGTFGFGFGQELISFQKKGFNVSSTGYFLYCDGDRFSDYSFLNQNDASMKFKMSLLSYEVNFDWIEPTLMNIRECLHKKECPDHAPACEYGQFLDAVVN